MKYEPAIRMTSRKRQNHCHGPPLCRDISFLGLCFSMFRSLLILDLSPGRSSCAWSGCLQPPMEPRTVFCAFWFKAVTPSGINGVSERYVFKISNMFSRMPSGCAPHTPGYCQCGRVPLRLYHHRLTLSGRLICPRPCLFSHENYSCASCCAQNATVINARFTCFLISFFLPAPFGTYLHIIKFLCCLRV